MDSWLNHKVVDITCWNQLEIELAKLLTQVRVNLMHLDIVEIALASQRIGYDIRLPRRVLNINGVLSKGLNPPSLPQVQIGLSEQVLQTFVIGEHIHLPPKEEVSPSNQSMYHCSQLQMMGRIIPLSLLQLPRGIRHNVLSLHQNSTKTIQRGV